MFELRHAGGPKWEATDEEGNVVKVFSGKKAEVLNQFNAWASNPNGEEEEVEVAEDVKPPAKAVNLPDPSKLSGRAKTAALNAQSDSVFVEGEWTLKSGVHNEANRVYNLPDGYQAAWATPRHIDGGRHANYLRERGYRPVYRDEMGQDMYEDAMYIAFIDESDSEFVFMSGAQLFIGPMEKLAKIREREYDAHMAAFRSKQEDDQEFAESLGGTLQTKRDSSIYNPMGS